MPTPVVEVDVVSGRSSGIGSDILRLLAVAAPLIASSLGLALKLFIDRLMLGWYSSEAIQAAMPAGVAVFTFTSFFLGVAGYSRTFVAQLTGAGRSAETGAAIWQGFWVALVGGVCLAALAPFAGHLFTAFGHAPAVIEEESRYAAILAGGSVFPLVSAVACSFWSGRSRTLFPMMLGLGTAALNAGINWFLIFGNLGAPRLGIVGAGLGTVISEAVGATVALALLFGSSNRATFGLWPTRTFVPELMRRLVRFGLPCGIHFVLDMASFAVFILLMGRFGTVNGAKVAEASNIAFSFNSLAFMPMIGVGHATSILVGTAVGARDIPAARRVVVAARIVCLAYMAMMATFFLIDPDLILHLFVRSGDVHQAATLDLARHLLWFICVWLLFDGWWIVHQNALQGAGDTRFPMIAAVGMGWLVFALPCLVAQRLGAPVGVLWTIMVGYVMLGGAVMWLRYRQGKWATMQVIA